MPFVNLSLLVRQLSAAFNTDLLLHIEIGILSLHIKNF